MFLYILPIICASVIVAISFGSRQILPLTIDGITTDRALDYITLSFAFAVGQVMWGFANYVGGNSGGGNSGGGYGGGNSESNSSYTNKSSGAEGWEDRSYGNSSENSEYESGRSRRKRGVSNESNASNETN